MSKLEKVTVVGGGAFGVALAKLAADKSEEIALWARDAKVCASINQNRHHPTRLSNITLPRNVTALADLKLALVDARTVILALPMEALKPVLKQAHKLFSDDAVIVCTAKGIDEEGLALPSDVLKSCLRANLADRACFLSGPSFAVELALGLPTALTLASHDKKAAVLFQESFSRETCRLYRSDDVTGVCVGGALKNVIAIAAGACTGLGLGRNALASLITRGLAEISRLAIAMGGRQATISGLSGAGDLILSCTDDMSRNHRLGTLLADGMPLEQALQMIASVVEGSKTTRAIPRLVAKYGIDMPICMAVYRVLYEGLSTQIAISSLLERRLKEEAV